MPTRASHPLAGRLYDRYAARSERRYLADHWAALVEGLEGTVVDVGGGTGVLFPYYAALDPTPTVHVVDPGPGFLARAAEKRGEYDLAVHLHRGRAEALPFRDGTVDAVVASRVLCSVTDLDAALAEVVRVLGEGGEFRFLEHVRSGGRKGRLEDALTPVWKRLAGGCHLDRETGDRIAASGLELLERERMRLGRWVPVTYERGRAVPTVEGYED